MHPLHLLVDRLDVERIGSSSSIHRILNVSIGCTKVNSECVLSSSTVSFQDRNSNIPYLVDFDKDPIKILLQNIGFDTTGTANIRTRCVFLDFAYILTCKAQFAVLALGEECHSVEWLYCDGGEIDQREHAETKLALNDTALVLSFFDLAVGFPVFSDILNITSTLYWNPKSDLNVAASELAHVNHILTVRHGTHQLLRSEVLEEGFIERKEERLAIILYVPVEKGIRHFIRHQNDGGC